MVERIKMSVVSVMVFAIAEAQHHAKNGDMIEPEVQVVEVEDFDALAPYGWHTSEWYLKAKFGDEKGILKPLYEMRVGTILKKEDGDYIIRLA